MESVDVLNYSIYGGCIAMQACHIQVQSKKIHTYNHHGTMDGPH